MKAKRPKNKKTKLHITFDDEDRREYLLGFRKRKLARKEKAKAQLAEELKKEKREIKKKRLEAAKKMVGDGEAVDFAVEEERDSDSEEAFASAVTEYDHCTVEVSGLDLATSHHLHSKKLPTNRSKSQNKGESSRMKNSVGIPLKRLSSKLLSKTSLLKSTSRKTKIRLRGGNKKKNKKIQITEL